jgi:exodeoxyribonuclease VII small subunit
MPEAKDDLKEIAKLPFEEALKRLEGIVERMEDGKAPLEELIVLFEKGGALASLCQKRLDELQGKIEILVKDSAKAPKWEDFDPESDESRGRPSDALSEDADAEEPSPPAAVPAKTRKAHAPKTQGPPPEATDVLF